MDDGDDGDPSYWRILQATTADHGKALPVGRKEGLPDRQEIEGVIAYGRRRIDFAKGCIHVEEPGVQGTQDHQEQEAPRDA